MKLISTIILFLSLSVTSALAVFSDNFSQKFKLSIDSAMAESDAKERAKALINTIDNGTDTEVFYVFVLLFPMPILDMAKEANACKPQISNSLRNIEIYSKQSQVAEEKWIFENTTKIRKDTKNLIRCLHKYYKNGRLDFRHING